MPFPVSAQCWATSRHCEIFQTDVTEPNERFNYYVRPWIFFIKTSPEPMLIARVTMLLLALVSLTSHAAMTESFDGRWQLGDQHLMVTELTPSAGNSDQEERVFGGDALVVQYAFQSHKWHANARYSRDDDTIRAGTELSRTIGKNRSELELGRSWSGSGNGWWKQKSLRTTYEFSQENNGQTLVDGFVTEFDIVGANESSVRVQYHSGREFEAGQLIEFGRVMLIGSIRPREDIEMGVETQVGDKMDLVNTQLSEQRRVRPFLNWIVNDQLALQLNKTYFDLTSTEGQEILDARVINAHLTWQFDDEGSVRLSMQQSDVERNADAFDKSVEGRTKDVGSELRYSWKPNPQTEFNLGYSDAYDKDVELGIKGSASHNWFMQVGYTLAF
jgi:hypothetical protein